MKTFKLSIVAISCYLSASYASAQALPSVEQIKVSVQKETELMSCTEIINQFSEDTVPRLSQLITNPKVKSVQERQLSAAVLQEITNQIKLKCGQ